MQPIIHLIELSFSSGKKAFVRIATTDTERIPSLIEENRMWWEREERFDNWKISKREMEHMSRPDYMEYIRSYCDVVDPFGTEDKIIDTDRIFVPPPLPNDIDLEDLPPIVFDGPVPDLWK